MNFFLEKEKHIYKERAFYKDFTFFSEKNCQPGDIIDVYTYWLPLSDLYHFSCENNIMNFFVKEPDNMFLFLIHPSNLFYYSNFSSKYKKGPILKGIVTSSVRTIYIKHENNEFFVKLSLEIIGKSISRGEVSRSVGTTIMLDIKQKEHILPTDFKFFREIISAIPREYERGGIIIREVHADFYSNVKIYPAFSLFCEKKKLLLEIYKNVLQKYPKRTYNDFVKSFILYPFIKQYIKLRKLYISTQPHSQNLMFSLSEDGDEIKDFYYKDFGGFTLKLNEDMKNILPYIDDIEKEYYQGDINKNFENTLTYFNFGILYEMLNVEDCKLKIVNGNLIKEAIELYQEDTFISNFLSFFSYK